MKKEITVQELRNKLINILDRTESFKNALILIDEKTRRADSYIYLTSSIEWLIDFLEECNND